MHIYVRRGGPNYQTGLAKMRALGVELGIPLEVRNDVQFAMSSLLLIIFSKLRLKLSLHQYQ